MKSEETMKNLKKKEMKTVAGGVSNCWREGPRNGPVKAVDVYINVTGRDDWNTSYSSPSSGRVQFKVTGHSEDCGT